MPRCGSLFTIIRLLNITLSSIKFRYFNFWYVSVRIYVYTYTHIYKYMPINNSYFVLFIFAIFALSLIQLLFSVQMSQLTLQLNVNCGSRWRNLKRFDAGTKCKTRSFIQSNDISVILNSNSYQAEPVPRSEKLWGTTCKAIQLMLLDPFEPCGQSFKANYKSLCWWRELGANSLSPLSYPH